MGRHAAPPAPAREPQEPVSARRPLAELPNTHSLPVAVYAPPHPAFPATLAIGFAEIGIDLRPPLWRTRLLRAAWMAGVILASGLALVAVVAILAVVVGLLGYGR